MRSKIKKNDLVSCRFFFRKRETNEVECCIVIGIEVFQIYNSSRDEILEYTILCSDGIVRTAQYCVNALIRSYDVEALP